MKIFVINLKRDHKRRKNASRQLSEQNIDFEFFPAIEITAGWGDYFDDYNEKSFLINTGRRVTRGEIGCYASHKALWKKCIRLDEPLMIMEDDFLLDIKFSQAVKIVQENINSYHYIRLQSETRARREPAKSIGGFTLYRYSKIPHSAMCYAVTPRICQAFLSHSHSLCEPVDVMVKKAWRHQQALYGLAPYTVTESNLSSDSCIGQRLKDKKSLKVKFLRFIIKISWGFKLMQYNRKVKNNASPSE